MKSTQLIILSIFVAFTIIGVLVFAGIIPSPVSKRQIETTGSVTVWGIFPEESMINAFKIQGNDSITVEYKEHSEENFVNDLVEALANGTGPDIVIFPDSQTLRLASKIEPFPPETYDERTFRDTFIEEGRLFLGTKGVLALPIGLNPLVMYWNKDMFFTANVPNPPRYWDEFLTLAPILTKRSDANDILKSAIAFGEWTNVTHAKDILALLALQIGNPLTEGRNESVGPVFTGVDSRGIPPINEVIRFYTDFADPVKPVYSWNRSLPQSKDAFLSQDLAVYFGYADELFDIQAKNPNLNFDVAPVPQVRNSAFKKTFGKMIGVAVMKSSTKKPLAFFMASSMASASFQKIITDTFHIPPVLRSSLSIAPTNDPYKKVFYDAILSSDSWLDPNPEKTDKIFQSAMESIASGKSRIETAVVKMQAEFGLLLK